jgi:hypothetical protein
VVVHLTAGLERRGQASTLGAGGGDHRSAAPRDGLGVGDDGGAGPQRLAESRRITLAFLETWPDAPHLDATYEHPFFGEMTAVAYHLIGINHAKGHLAQLAEIRRQERP